MEKPTAENVAEADRALNRGRFALRVIFPNDRLLNLLITHLEYGIAQRLTEQQPQGQGPDLGDAP